MRFSRTVALKIHFLLDQCLPPFIRDSRWLLRIPFQFFFRDMARHFIEFKTKAMGLSSIEFEKINRAVSAYDFERETCLTPGMVDCILQATTGQTVLEVGCGSGFLAGKLSQEFEVTACDLLLSADLQTKYAKVKFIKANAECLPFRDQSFDTIVCTHTLEHVQNIFLAVKELRRVARKRIIIVVPRQRPYRFTFDLHLHFFPYPESLLAMMGPGRNNHCTVVDSELFYVEVRAPDEETAHPGQTTGGQHK